MTRFRASAGFTEQWNHFDFNVADGVATITLTRPEQLGALTFDVYADLRDLLAELPHRGDARVLVITGTGRGFCSGGDVVEIIGALQSMQPDDLIEFTRGRMAHFKCPTAIEFRAELLRTATGKLQKYKLREPFWAGRDRRVS